MPKSRTSEYHTWREFRARCQRPTHKDFHQYGGRGIKVCDRWQKFDNFLADMGPRPDPSLTLERENNDGDYEPANCRWATRLDQGRNRRGVYTAKHDQVLREAVARGLNFAQVAELVGKSHSSVSMRAYRIGLKSGHNACSGASPEGITK